MAADPERDRALLRRKLLGWSLTCAPVDGAVDLARDLVLGPGGDFTRVEGVANLGQALAIALTTPLTGDVFNVDFGFDGLNAIAEESVPIMVQERLRISVITALQKDPRVRRIVDVQLQDGRLTETRPDTQTLSQVDAGTRRRILDVRVVFETVAGDAQTIDLGKVVPNG